MVIGKIINLFISSVFLCISRWGVRIHAIRHEKQAQNFEVREISIQIPQIAHLVSFASTPLCDVKRKLPQPVESARLRLKLGIPRRLHPCGGEKEDIAQRKTAEALKSRNQIDEISNVLPGTHAPKVIVVQR
jgi:hypothetical protein